MPTEKQSYRFPLAIQLTVPNDNVRDKEFQQVLSVLREHRFTGVELNIIHPERIDPADLQDILGRFELKMTQYASGAAAKARGLSLTAADESVHRRSIAACLGFIDFARLFQAGVIIGFMKGPGGQDQKKARIQFEKALNQIAPRAFEAEVPVLVEATNRYESTVANSLQDAVDLITPFADNPFIRLLPDTFHMNIEEKDAPAALKRHAALFDWIHISDNNRFFPGLGALDFAATLAVLKHNDYRGGVAIEGNVEKDLISDIHATVDYLAPLLKTD